MNWDEPKTIYVAVALGLVALRYLFELWLDHLNTRHVKKHANAIPEPFKEIMDEQTYQKSVRYTLAKARLGTMSDTYSTVLVIGLLFFGTISIVFNTISTSLGESHFAQATTLWAVLWLFSLMALPFSWYTQFKLEERFGFNTSTQKIWWGDQAKGLMLSFIIGVPLLWLILWLTENGGEYWWLWVWGVIVAFQLLMSVLAPIFILPLFNKFTPLPDGELKDRLNRLAERTGFINAGIQVMDGSRRSKHSNAFFTGLGKGRKIALFDTLIEQLDDKELEAVLAHEIGHFKLRHVPKMIMRSFITTLVGLYLLNLLAQQPAFVEAFGFTEGYAPAFLVFSLLAGTVTFWLTPISSLWSRKYEFQADAFAANAIGTSQPMITALRKLNRENLSNLTPHPLYSGFHYDHPTLLERETALGVQETGNG